MNLDVLAFAPHPDDAELLCGGLLLLAKRAGKKSASIDVTRGDMGTRGTIETRAREAAAARRNSCAWTRAENLGLPDGHLFDNEELRTALVRALRKYRPKLVLIPHWEDQHPDHAACGQAGLYAAWLAGAPKYDPDSADGVANDHQPPYRPQQVLHYNNRYGVEADLVVDISSVIEEKLALAKCYRTQFGPNGGRKAGPQTKLSRPGFHRLSAANARAIRPARGRRVRRSVLHARAAVLGRSGRWRRDVGRGLFGPLLL